MGRKKIVSITEAVRIQQVIDHTELYTEDDGKRFDAGVFLDLFCQKKKKKTSSRKKGEEASYITYRFRGYPTEEQEQSMKQTIGCCRFFWNRMVGDRLDLYRIMGETLYNTPADYKDASGLEFLRLADSNALANVQLNVERAFSEWLKGEKGKPRFKKKYLCPDSYKTCLINGNIRLTGEGLVLPKVPGAVKIEAHRPVEPGGTLKSVTVTREPDGKWYFSIQYQYPSKEEGDNTFLETEGDVSPLKVIGLDMSIPHMYVDSNGEYPYYYNNGNRVDFEKHYLATEKKIAREQRKLSRMEKDSANYRDQCIRISRLHAKAKHQRGDFKKQVACRLAREYDVVAVEDLDIAAMKKSLRLGKSLSDNGWGGFIQLLEQQCIKYGHLLIRVGKWFPSSKTCISCGYIHRELKLNDRLYVCPECGNAMDRDHQAALNIKKEAVRILAEEYSAGKECGWKPVSLEGLMEELRERTLLYA